MKSQIVFRNLKAEMARHDISIQKMADKLEINRDTLSRKLSRKTQINLDEVFKIQKIFFPEVGVCSLFKELSNEESSKAS